MGNCRLAARALVLLVAALLHSSAAFSGTVGDIGVEQLLRKITFSLYTGDSDASIAREVDRTEVNQRFAAEDLQLLMREGVGPETSRALRRLAERSGSQPQATQKIVDLEVPTNEEVRRIFRRIVKYTSGYVRGLVDFSCDIETRKLVADLGNRAKWRLLQTSVQTVRYQRGLEVYESKRGKRSAPDRSGRLEGDFHSSGEFAGLMSGIFASATRAQFRWDHWEVMDGRKLAVFSFEVEAEHSSYEIETTRLSDLYARQINLFPAYRGWIYGDPDSGTIRRILVRATLPNEYTTRVSANVLDYGDVRISDKVYPLLTHAMTYMLSYTEEERSRLMLEKSFSNYRKFEADSRLITGP